MALDPEEDDSAAPATNSVDASSSPVHSAWQKWTSDPANNAALLQFGVAMLQPRAPGQTALGAAANAVAEGGGAAGRVTAAQDAEDLASSKEDALAAESAAKTSNAASAAVNADAYSRGIDNTIANPKAKGGLTAAMRIQGDYRKWLAKPEDTTGMLVDPIVQAVQRQFPQIKTKGDLLANPAANAAAMRLFQSQIADPTSPDDAAGDSVPSAAIPPAAPPKPTFVPRQAKDKNGKVWTEAAPGVFKDSQGNVYTP